MTTNYIDQINEPIDLISFLSDLILNSNMNKKCLSFEMKYIIFFKYLIFTVFLN